MTDINNNDIKIKDNENNEIKDKPSNLDNAQDKKENTDKERLKTYVSDPSGRVRPEKDDLKSNTEKALDRASVNEDNKLENNALGEDKTTSETQKVEVIPLENMSLEEAFESKRGNLKVSLAPHLRTDRTTRKVMLDVLIALTPALIYSAYIFGMRILLIVLLSVTSAVVTEALVQKAFKKPVLIGDLSAVVTGVLLAFNLPATVPFWIPIIGAMFATGLCKEFFGGIGSNFVNPALAGRAALMMSWPTIMTNYVGADGISGATPLQILKGAEGTLPSIKAMFIGNIGGVLGETSALLLLIGFIYLIIKKVVDYRISIIYIISTMLFLYVLGVRGEYLIYHLLGGGLILGAFFMATDYVTAPITFKGKAIFAFLCGLLTALIRIKGGMPEGVSYSILIMNLTVPLIDSLTRPKVFGSVKKR